MSWLFSKALMEDYENSRSSQGQEAESSEGNSLDGEPYAQLNVMPTQHKFYCNGKMIDPSNLSLFGLTSKVLMENHGKDLLMWFQEGSLAKILVQRERAQESMESEADYGPKCRELLAKFDQDTHSWKTLRCLFQEESILFSVTWPCWGLMQDGESWALDVSALPIEEIDYGLSLPTPSGCRSGKNHVVGRLDEWGGSGNPWRGTEIGKMRSPTFEEWMMGWPERWTELTVFEMDKFQSWLQQHGEFLAENEP